MVDVVIISTAIAGSLLLALGVDVFLQTGFSNLAVAILKNQASIYQISGNAVYGLLIGAIVTALMGILVQYRITGRRPYAAPK